MEYKGSANYKGSNDIYLHFLFNLEHDYNI